MIGPDGYPYGWQQDDPGPYPLGMPIWRDSWGDMPALLYYGNGTTSPGPLLPNRYIAQTSINLNAGLGPALEPIPLSVLMKPSDLPKPKIPTPLRFSDYTKKNPPIGAQVASLNSLGLAGGNFLYQTQAQRANITGYSGAAVNSRTGDVINAASGLCDSLPPGYKEACKAAASVGRVLTGTTPALPSTSTALVGTQCPAGWANVNGTCVDLRNAAPGGDPVTLTRSVAAQGGMGLTAVTPIQVGTITRNDGSTGPILRCPRRYVLGQDYLCYPKSMIPNQLRAHPRGTRPLLTGGEVKILRRAKTLEKKVSKLGRQFGKKTCSCGPTKRRKK